MRSKIYLILIALFVFFCSSDSSSDDGNSNNNGGNNNSGNALLVSEIITTSVESSDYVYTDRYIYDGNKLTTIIEESEYNGNSQVDFLHNFVYTNDKITRVDEYYSGTLDGRYTFEYDNQGRISFFDYCSFTSSGTCEYYDTNNLTYSSNGIVSIYSVYNVGSVDEENAGTLTIQLDNNGNMISATDSDVNGSFQYDSQNSPYKNIVGMDAIILFTFVYNPLRFNANNNCMGYSFDYVNENATDEVNFAYDYNEDGYPRQVIVTEGSYSSTVDISYY